MAIMSGVRAIHASQSKLNGGKQATERRPVATAATQGQIRNIIVRLAAPAFNDATGGVAPAPGGDVQQVSKRHASRGRKRD
jgi:hypothetical protein